MLWVHFHEVVFLFGLEGGLKTENRKMNWNFAEKLVENENEISWKQVQL